ncbi:hypothetical protein AC579_4866 [Pseudocercospora musae]|uniref:BTB domain-containing protein n=1 Tax=Pseudocercospora musae TaxID=113226 RepID=A0A139IKK7_9PEZI|nr:hypothetical protein AC579_4866 [Pseudocercospora musae]
MNHWRSIRAPPPDYATDMMATSELVEVTVSGQGHINSEPKVFKVPRVLLCAHSDYFKKACEWKARAGESLSTDSSKLLQYLIDTFTIQKVGFF